MQKIYFLIIGGIAGTLARYFFGNLAHRVLGVGFPYGTLVVNLSGCLIIGFLAALMQVKAVLSPNMRLLLMVGFCGAFTTFSSFIFETDALVRDTQFLWAFLNISISVILGFVLFRVGYIIGQIL